MKTRAPRLLFNRLPRRREHCHAAVTRLGAHAITAPHTHDFPECFLVLAGGGWHCREGHRAVLKPGQLAWVEPADCHWFETGAEPLEFANLAFAPGWWRQCRQLGRPRLAPAVNRLVPVALDPATRSFLEGGLTGLLGEQGDRGGHLLAWVMRAVEVLAAAKADATPVATPPIWLAALLHDLTNPAFLVEPIGWWQRRSGRSKEHLARACRRHCGATLTELLQRARISRAQRLLLAGDMKITTLAFETGFGHLGHFHEVFKRETGLTPSEWQRRHAVATVPRSG
jgi:AraC-like DNA-binding protein/quercetin dioxygenase-like cupin family protein